MRLWSIHPKYLDGRGLVALWREGLLARKVLLGRTKGYRNHPQLERFKTQADPVAAIDCYLRAVFNDAALRGYKFDTGKMGAPGQCQTMPVTGGQLNFEMSHLRKKLRTRDRARCLALTPVKNPDPHPLFTVVAGGIEPWERGGSPLPGSRKTK